MRVIDPIPIDLDKPRSILLTLPALKAVEDQLAKQRGEKRVNLFQVFAGGDLGAMELLIILWAGLRHEDQTLTLQKTLDLVAKIPIRDWAEVVNRAIELHIGVGQPDKTGAPTETPGQEASDGAPLA